MKVTAAAPSAHEARAIRAARAALRHFGTFMRAFPPRVPYREGRHSVSLDAMLQKATEAVESGGKYFGVFVCPPRHGKSDRASRRYPAWHLLRNPTHEVILTGYSGDLVNSMAHASRDVYATAGPAYGLGVAEGLGQLAGWATTRGGAMWSVGLGGTITGRGAHVLVVDDYLKGRQEAESKLIRDRIWDSFRNDLWTRLAPERAVVIPCTRWHDDDLVGRILKEPENDPDFPVFEVVVWPAQLADGGWLFPERYDDSWYKQLKAVAGPYAWAAQAQGSPVLRHGKLLRTDMIQWYTGPAPVERLRMARGWDVASTSAERVKDDPDYTAGVMVGVAADMDVWILDVVRGQWEAPERNRIILDTAESDGPAVKIEVECVGGYKDAGVEISRALKGKATVTPRSVSLDKVARAAIMETPFETGKVHVPRDKPWAAAFVEELTKFPEAPHDDQVDAMIVAYEKVRVRHWFIS